MSYIYPTNVYFKRFSSKKVGIFFKKYAYFVNSLRQSLCSAFNLNKSFSNEKALSTLRANLLMRIIFYYVNVFDFYWNFFSFR